MALIVALICLSSPCSVLFFLPILFLFFFFFFFFSSRRRHTRSDRDWSSDVCSSDLFEKYTVPVTVAIMVLMSVLAWSQPGVVNWGLKSTLEPGAHLAMLTLLKIGRASCRERV